MKKTKHKLNSAFGSVIMLLFLSLCCMVIVSELKVFHAPDETIQIRLQEMEAAGQAYDFVEKGENQISGQHFVWWCQDVMQTVRAKELETELSDVDVLELCGNSGILFDSAIWLDYRDSTKCLVSDGLAYELFGTTDAAGLTVMWQEREYQVIGNIETGKKVMACETAADSEAEFGFVTIENTEGKSVGYLTEQFTALWGNGVLIDWQFMIFLLKAFVFVVQFVILLMLGRRIYNISLRYCRRGSKPLFKDGWKKWISVLWKQIRKNDMVFTVLVIAFAIIVIVLVKSFYLPADYISGIADRQFWVELIREKRDAFYFFIICPKTFWEFEKIRSAFVLLIFPVIELILCNLKMFYPHGEECEWKR